MNEDTKQRIQKSWSVRREFLNTVLERGQVLVDSLKLIPETRAEITSERWTAIVREELEAATRRYGNGEPLLSETELVTLAALTSPARGW